MENPLFPFGTIGKQFMRKIHLSKDMSEAYKKANGAKIQGGFMFGKAILTINDPDLAKQILVKDFNYFVDTLEVSFDKNSKNAGDLTR